MEIFHCKEGQSDVSVINILFVRVSWILFDDVQQNISVLKDYKKHYVTKTVEDN